MSLLDNVLGYGAYTCGVHNSLQSMSKSATYHRDAYIRHILHILAPIRMHKSVIFLDSSATRAFSTSTYSVNYNAH